MSDIPEKSVPSRLGLDLFTIEEVANELRVQVSNVRRYVRENQIAHIKLPCGSVRIERDRLERFIQRHRRGPTSDIGGHEPELPGASGRIASLDPAARAPASSKALDGGVQSSGRAGPSPKDRASLPRIEPARRRLAIDQLR